MKTSVALAALLLTAASAAQAHEDVFKATLLGSNENPPNASTATGSATVTLDLDTLLMTVDITFAGLSIPASASHIHCCTAAPNNVGVATQTPTFIGFPKATSGHYVETFDMALASSYNASFITAQGGTVSGAFNALVAGMEGGLAYVNIHTAPVAPVTGGFPGGEIRGFLALQPVPEPATYGMMALGLVGVIGAARRRRA